jgi:hypothetical protein
MNVNGLVFHHPAAWRDNPGYSYAGTFLALFNVLSNQNVADPCTVRTRSELDCGSPRTPLVPGGVVATWTEYEDTSMDEHPWLNSTGTATTIAGYPARVYDGPPLDWCQGEGGTREVIAAIRYAGLTTFTVCIRGPHDEQAAAVTHAILASIRPAKS